MVHNDAVNFVDTLGLWETDVHHDIVDGWLADNPYANFPWHCCKVPVKALLKDGSDAVDGAGGHFLNFLSAQASRNAYQHAMRSPRQTVAEAQALYNKFLDDHINRARNAANQARGRRCWGSDSWCCAFIQAAVREIGKAYHAYSDSLSPSHSGFQTWWGPIDGVREFGTVGYYAYVRGHAEGETMEVYQGMKDSAVRSVKGRFQGVLDEILKE